MTISELTFKSNDLEPVAPVRGVHELQPAPQVASRAEALIVAESYEAGETVSAVARRYALSPQQPFSWRRAARQPSAEAVRDAGVIELEVDGIAMRVGRSADTKTVAAVIRALNATS